MKLSVERLTEAAKGGNNGTDVKMYLYSGHDTGPIMPMLGFFQFQFNAWSPYASMINIELFEDVKTGNLYVLTTFNGQIILLPSPCDGDNNEHSMCSWEAFLDYVKPVIPTSEECSSLEAALGHTKKRRRKKKY